MFTSKRLVILMAAFGFIFMNACSRSGGGSSPIQTAPNPVATPNPHSELDGSSGKSSTEDKDADDDSGPKLDDSKSAPASGKVKPAKSRTDDRQVNDDDTSNDIQVSDADSSGGDSSGPQLTDYDPTGKTPDQLYSASEALGPAYNGKLSDVRKGGSGALLRWSGSAIDDLREQIQRFVDSKSGAHKAADEAFAKTLSRASVEVDWSTRTANVRIVIKQTGRAKTVSFSGPLSNKLLLRAGSLKIGNKMRIEAACMDLDGGCQTTYLKVQDASSGRVDTAHMLVRSSRAYLYAKAQPGFGAARNAEFDRLLAVLKNSEDSSGYPGALRKLTLRTSETISGSSSYRVEMQILTQQRLLETLNLGGKLVKPAHGFEMGATVDVLRSTSMIADTVRGISMIANDGRGLMTLAVTIRKGSEEASEDKALLTIARIQKPARKLILL